VFPIKEGSILGRAGVDVRLNDGKVSSRHAEVRRSKTGEFQLVDLKSRNGLKIDGQRVDQVALTRGTTVQIGNSHLEVQLAPEAAPKKREEPRAKPWTQNLSDYLQTQKPKTMNKEQVVQPFSTPVKLKFIRGPQLMTEWTLGYGPRDIGAGGIDLHLTDEQLPEKAFSIHSENGSPRFLTDHRLKVTLNDLSTSAEMLKDGDLIKIGNTWIRISFGQ